MYRTLWPECTIALYGIATPNRIWQYNVDFVAYPLLAAALFALHCRSLEWMALAGFGILLFTLVEYFAHRIVLHDLFYHSQHQRHHTHPHEYTVFPLWYTPAIFAGFFLILPLSIFAGFVVGYCWFLYWHDLLHHFDLKRLPRAVQRYALWHLGHHRDEAVNFGISVPIWDFLFGSYRH